MTRLKFDIKLFEFQKIFNILNGTLNYANPGEKPSCQFYNVTAALILESVYRIKARPIMGAAFIKPDNHTDNVIAFANLEEMSLESDEQHFHCWLQTNSNFLDFTAPVYCEYLNTPQIRKRFMFQKPITSMSDSPYQLMKAGDFYFQPNIPLTQKLLSNGTESTKFIDFANIAVDWARNSKKALLKSKMIQADDGELITLNASKMTLEGSW